MDGDAHTAAPRASALLALVRSAASLDRTQSDPVVAARNALGVAAPLAVGALLGNAAIGLPSTIGALQTAFADRPGPYRLRMLRMAATAGTAALTGTLAVALSGSDAASAVLLLVVAFAAGLMLAWGASGTQVGVAATAAALVLGHQVQRPSLALHIGLLVLAGGAVQMVLAVAAWPLGRHRPERTALAGLYSALADLARRPEGTRGGPPLGDTLADVRATLFGLGHDHGPSVEAYRVLLDEAERIRRELVLLGGYVDRLRSDGHQVQAAAATSVLSGAATVLREIAAELETGRAIPDGVLDPVRSSVEHALTVLDAAAQTRPEPTYRAAASRVRELAAQLRAAVETARTGAGEGKRAEPTHVSGAVRLRDPLATVRANLTPGSAVFRHAVRLAVLVFATDLVVRMASIGRGYWIPLTVLVSLRPDFASTFQRSTMRAIGTVLGLFVATALVHWVPGGQWYAIALVALFFFGMRLAGPGNLGIGAMCIAGLVVILLSLAGVSPHTTVLARGADTLIGAALALIASLAWPVWERRVLPARLADLVAAYREYTEVVADLTRDPARLNRARIAARRARTTAQGSVDRARAEPVPAQREIELGETVLANTHRFIHAMLTIEALRPAIRDAGGVHELRDLLTATIEVLDRLEATLRLGAAIRPQPALRERQLALVQTLRQSPARAGGPEPAAALVDASDRLVESLDTLIAEIRRQRETPAAVASGQ